MDTLEEIAAGQKVRAFDIYALGPFLLWASMQKKPLGRWTRRTLFVAGCMTILYNYKSYKRIAEGLHVR